MKKQLQTEYRNEKTPFRGCNSPVSGILFPPFVWRTPIIYLGPASLQASNGLPPGRRAGSPYPDKIGIPGIFDLSTHKVYPPGMLPYRRVSSYLAISPLSHLVTCDETRRYLFCGTVCPRGVQPQSLPVRKYGALCCPDFPPITSQVTGQAIERAVAAAKVSGI